MVATDTPLRDTLDALIAHLEALCPGAPRAIFVVSSDGRRFSECRGSSVPHARWEAWLGQPIDRPSIAPWCEVALAGSPIELPDIDSAASYAPSWRDDMRACGFRSMRAAPIVAADGVVLGVIATFPMAFCAASPADQRAFEVVSQLAQIALTRARTRQSAAARDARLEATGRQFADLIENAPFGTYVADADFRLALASQSARAAFGIEGLIGMDLGDALRKMWPDRFAREAIARFRNTLATGEPYLAKNTVERRADIDAVEAYEWRIDRIVMPDGRFGIVCYFYDFTERQRMEAKLRASEARFAHAFEQAPSFMAMLQGPEHIIEIANPNYRKLVGRDDLIGRAMADALPDAVAQGYVRLLDRVYASNQAYSARGARYEMRPAAGGPADERFVDFVFQPIADDSNAITHVFVEGFDVTDRIKTEWRLRESEHKLRLFVERAPVAIAMFDRDMRYLIASRRYIEDYGLARLSGPEALLGRSVSQVFPDIPHHSREFQARVLAGETLSSDADLFVRADGRKEWLRWEMTPWRQADGTIGGAVLFSELVTTRVDSEAALAASEARFRAAIDAVDGVLWTNNAQGEMEGEQPAWAALTGQTYEDYQGYGWARALHPDDARASVEAWGEAVAARRTFVFEHRVRRRDNVWRHFAVRAIPVLKSDGAIKEWVGVHTDITRQRQAETILARDKEQLEQLVAERTRALQEVQTRLAHAQRMEALGQLAGGIAHDFNNVLQAVQGGAGLIERRADNPEAVRDLARLVVDSAARGSAITRRLLTFSRRADLRTVAVDPTTLLNDLRDILTHTLGSGISVRIDAPTDLPPLLADKSQLETVLINMATNARDAMDGVGALTLSAAVETLPKADAPHPTLDVQAGLYLRLSVADTGVGMAPEVLARVTEPFFTTKPQGKGTGLGLAIARGFVEQSGGAMLIESRPRQGTTVHFWLPKRTPG